MAVLEKALAEEYERVQVRLQQIESELDSLPKGYISEKKLKIKHIIICRDVIKQKLFLNISKLIK